MKKTWIAVIAICLTIIAVVGILFFIFGKSQPLTIFINNQNKNQVSGEILFLDKIIEVPVIASNTEQTQIVDISEIRKNSSKSKETGKIVFKYNINNTWNEVEIFGYVEPADNYLYGKKAKVTIAEEGKASVKFID
ncbi:MAG TPA: hypothetical protein PK566_00235 [Pseudobacteroides sp.]|nr:hypothetical protein [Pseudobacteroides sp.]